MPDNARITITDGRNATVNVKSKLYHFISTCCGFAVQLVVLFVEQEQSESADLRQGESAMDPDPDNFQNFLSRDISVIKFLKKRSDQSSFYVKSC